MSLYRVGTFAVRGCLVGAAVIGALVVMPVPGAKAACIGGDSICTAFDPSTVSNIQNAVGFSGSYIQPVYPLNQARILFDLTGYTGAGFSISSITVASATGKFSPLNFGGLSLINGLNSGSRNRTGFQPLGTNIGTYDLSDLRISFVIPGSNAVNLNTQIAAQINMQNVDDPGLGSITSLGDFVTTAQSHSNPVPGPLPILGAAAAFGLSRKLRRRVRQSA